MSAAAPAAAVVPPKPRLREVLASPRMLAILALGCASGLPFNLTDATLQAWLKDVGVTNTTIGLLTLVGVPYAWKFLWAPFLDRYQLPALGRRRGWIALFQLLLAAALALLALQDPAASLWNVAILAVAVAFLSASQDIVIDAYRTDLARPEERGLAATATSIGYRAAAWFAFAFALILADWAGWKVTYLAMAALMAAFAIATWLAPEPDYKVAPPRTLVESVVEPIRELVATPGMVALLVLLVLYKVGDAFALRLFTPFLMDVGFTKTEIGGVAKTVMAGATIGGTVLGGLWMVRLGLARALLWFGIVQTVANFAYLVLALTGKNWAVMVGAVAIDNLAGGMGAVALTAFVMALCDVRFSAFQYAALSAIAVIPRTYLGVPAGWLADSAGWPTFYAVSVAIAVPGLVMAWAMRRRLAELDAGR